MIPSQPFIQTAEPRHIPQQVQLERLNRLLAETWKRNPFYSRKWAAAGLSARAIQSLEELKQYPFTTREELIADQSTAPPLGRNLTFPLANYRRIHRSSGTTHDPIFWADTKPSWEWVMGCSRTLFVRAGAHTGDRIFFALNFGVSSGPWIIYEGARQLGCCCFTAGSSEARVRLGYLQHFRPGILVAGPAALFELSETARTLGIHPASLGIRKIISFGKDGCGIATIRDHARAIWDVECFDRYGMTEAGSIAGECESHPGGMHLLENEFVAEVISPETMETVPDGEPGELVLTTLGRVSRPIVRYRTGDLTRLVREHDCPCGRADALLFGGVTRRS